MALTPEDVVNKRFQPTKFREGYDQDEVDDFLDEVVVELRRLNQENEELRQRLIASDSRISELQRSGGASSAQESTPAPVVAAPAPVEEPTPAPTPAVVAPVPAPVAAAPVATSSDEDDDPAVTTNLLQLARQLHEQHVRAGAEKRDELIAEGHAQAARVVAEAEAEQRAKIAVLEEERSALEAQLEDLRVFETEYRQKLRSYIEGQLRELDTPPTAGSNSVATAPPANYSGFAGK